MLVWKMSAKSGAITQRMPKSSSAQGACSRELPQPKFSCAIRISARRYGSWLSTKSGFSEPSARKRSVSNRCLPSPVRLMIFRKRAGMILSVSTLASGSGAATPVSVVNACITRTPARRRAGPVTAAAAAIAGESRCVRPPGPCRPSKLRFDVLAQRCPAISLSGFMPRHIEHPASRHSKPASVSTRSSPSASACCFTSPEPGTTSARTPAATCRPRAIAAAARMSSMRPLVQLPMNTTSIGTSVIRVPGVSAM